MFVSEIISYPELVAREKANLQKGMNFGIRPSSLREAIATAQARWTDYKRREGTR